MSRETKKTRIKKSCWWLDDGLGLCCNGFRKREAALKEMQSFWDTWDDSDIVIEQYGDNRQLLVLENIKEETALFCKNCDYFSIDNDGKFCGECAEAANYSVKVFTIYFNSS